MRSRVSVALAAVAFFLSSSIPAACQIVIDNLQATSNSPGTSALAELTLSASLTNTDTQAQTITIKVSDTNYTFPALRPLTLVTTTSGTFSPDPGSGATSVGGSTVNVKSYGDASNVINGTGFPGEDFSSTAPPNTPLFSFSDVSTVPGFNPSGAYSLSIVATFTLAAHTKLTNFSAVLQARPESVPAAVPEPGTYALLAGLVVPSVTLLRRRRA